MNKNDNVIRFVIVSHMQNYYVLIVLMRNNCSALENNFTLHAL